MIAPCLLSGYLWRTCWVRFRAPGRDEPDQPSAAKLRLFAYQQLRGMPSWPFRSTPPLSRPIGRFWRGFSGLLGTAEAFCKGKGIAPDDIIQARLAEDMLPFAYQVKSTAVHSLGAIEGVRRGVFSPDVTRPPDNFAALKARIADTRAAVGGV